jgi:pimeloyl-ACP methyl ester carboxylesterase
MTRTAVQATSAFYGTSPGVRAFRWSMGAVQRLWPALAVRAAVRLFCTPLPPKWMHRRVAWSPEWRAESWPFEDASVTVHTLRPGERPGFDRPVLSSVEGLSPNGKAAFTAPLVLLVHGWGGHGGQMLSLARAVAAEGWQPVVLEMPAHGRSAGARSNLPQFARALDYVTARLRQQGHTVHAVVAHSLGANAAAFATSRGLPAQRLVLLAPPASPRNFTRLFAAVFGLSESTRASMQARIEAAEGALMAAFEPPVVGPRIGVPTLVVHDRHDSINRFADGEAFTASIAGARLHVTEGLGHRKLLHDGGVIGTVIRFLR